METGIQLKAKERKNGRPRKNASKLDGEKCLQLRFAKGLSEVDIGKYFGVSHQAVNEKIKRFKELLLNPEDLELYREKKVELNESIELGLLALLADPKKMEAASLNNAAFAYSQVFNATRLLRNQSTSNIDIQEVSVRVEAFRQRCIKQFGRSPEEMAGPEPESTQK